MCLYVRFLEHTKGLLQLAGVVLRGVDDLFGNRRDW